MPEEAELGADKAILEQLYRQVGNAPEGELVSQELLRERREEAVREEAGE